VKNNYDAQIISTVRGHYDNSIHYIILIAVINFFSDLPVATFWNEREKIVMIVTLIPTVVIKAIVTARAFTVHETIIVKAEVEKTTVNGIRVTVDIVTPTRMRSVGDLIRQCQLEIVRIERTICAKLDRYVRIKRI
jgi:hypothetical protein